MIDARPAHRFANAVNAHGRHLEGIDREGAFADGADTKTHDEAHRRIELPAIRYTELGAPGDGETSAVIRAPASSGLGDGSPFA